MDILTQKKFLNRIIIFLIVLNLFSIGAFIWKDYFRKPRQKTNSSDNGSNENRDVLSILEKELNLTEKQIEQMKKIRSDFPEKEKVVRENLNKERDSINAEIFNKNPDEELIKSLARRIADNEYKVELLRYEQANEIKIICKPEQLEKLEILVKDIRDYLRDNKQPKRK